MVRQNIGLLFLVSFLMGIAAHAGVEAYSGLAGEKLFIEKAPQLGAKAALIKFEGITSKWDGKIIKTETQDSTNGNRYSFEYEEELSSGVKKKTYQIVVGVGFELLKGSRVKKIELFYQEAGTKPTELNYDEELTKSSQKIDLIGAYKKSPYKPEVD